MSETVTPADATCGEEFRRERILRPDNTNCGGCGMSIGFSLLDRALGQIPVQLAIPACCGIVTAGGFPSSAYGVPVLATTFGGVSAFAAGMSAAAQLNNDPGVTICWAGDGGTYDIGVASMSGACERNDDMIYICYDNEIYGNTGGQRSGATPPGARTTTTPTGKLEAKKDMMGIVAGHHVPYAATLSLANPADFDAKVKKALQMKGFRFLLIHSPCPTGWKSEPSESVELVRMSVRNGIFPVYEIFDGVRYRINVEPTFESPQEYFNRQRRFPKGSYDIDAIKRQITDRWDFLHRIAEAFPARDDE